MRVTDVIGLVVLSAVILVAVIISGSLGDVAQGMDLGTEGNDTRDQLLSNLWTGLNLSSLGIIIAAAVGIIGLLLSAFGQRKGF